MGTLTFLLTDLEGSTRTWETQTRVMREAMLLHDTIIYGAIEANAGSTVESGREGDSILAVFTTAKDAARSALAIQRSFREAGWPSGLSLRTRVALHTGEVELRGGHYFGPPLNRCARLLALGHGGQILTTQATHELLVEDLPSQAELTDLGVHKLKDLKRSERIFQLTDLARPEQFPPLRSRVTYMTNLPIVLTRFVGREHEIAELRGMLEGTRLLTLTGTGGSGKTRLAKRLATEAAGTMTGGAWFVDLAPVSEVSLVARTTATALDLEEQQGRPLADTLAEHLAERPTLLVLDNCEHLLSACAELAERLLARCPELRILATSREPLNIGGEVTWRVPGLASSEAMQLFVERARSRSPQLEFSDRDAIAVGAICERLDGIPLAIELAAARVTMMPPEQILRRLDAGLGLLVGGDRTAAPRQQTLEATIDWSHSLLSAAERGLLRRLAVFSGGFSIDAAESVCDSDDLPRGQILELLSQLISKSLVQPVDDRFRLLDTIRAYARTKLLGAGELERTQRAHADYYLTLSSSRRPGRLAAWLEQMDDESDDLRAALAWCAGADPEMGASIAASLYEFWLGRGYAVEGRAFAAQLAGQLPTASALRARMLEDAGVFAYTAGDFAVAPTLVEQGLAIARRVGDRELIARGLAIQGGVALAAAQVDTAQRALDEALAIARALDRPKIEADALHHLGSLASVRGDPTLARARYTESLELRRRLGDADEAGTTLTLRAFVDILIDNLAEARSDIVEALELALALRDRRAGWSLDVLACIAAFDGDAVRALRLSGAARTVFESTAQHPPAMWSRFVDPLAQRARTRLGDEAANAEVAAGATLTFDQALHYALEPGA